MLKPENEFMLRECYNIRQYGLMTSGPDTVRAEDAAVFYYSLLCNTSIPTTHIVHIAQNCIMFVISNNL